MELETVPADQLAVSVRNPEKAEALQARGVDVRQGDFDRPETLASAFQGVDRLPVFSQLSILIFQLLLLLTFSYSNSS